MDAFILSGPEINHDETLVPKEALFVKVEEALESSSSSINARRPLTQSQGRI